MKAVVLFFDRSRGEGMIKGLDGCSGIREIYACNIPGKKTWYPETACVFYIEGEIIDITVTNEGRFIVPTTPGIFDKEKWNKLDQTKLAFKCDDSGKAINGFFK